MRKYNPMGNYNPLKEIDKLVKQTKTISARQKFINRFGEDPVDVLGNDWENHLDYYNDLVESEETCIDK